MISQVGSLPIIRPPLVDFCDQRFKCVQVVFHEVSRRCLIVFYRVLSFLVYPFSRTYFHRYDALANYYVEVGNRVSVYDKFGNQIINFCTNQSSQINEFSPPNTLEFHALQKQYSADVINSWCQIGTEAVPLKKENLQRCNRDLCLGISFDFIKKYLLALKTGKSSSEAVKSISKDYIDGAPTSAQLIQIFDSGLNFYPTIKALVDAQRSEIVKLLELREAEQLRIKKLNIEEPKIKKLLEDNESKFNVNLTSCVSRPAPDRFGPLSNFLGLKKIAEYGFDNSSSADFEKFINNLAPNAYLVQVPVNHTFLAHVLVLIKTRKDEPYHFIQDSNFATLRIGQSQLASSFPNAILTPYYTKRVTFESYELQES